MTHDYGVPDPERAAFNGFRVDVLRGERVGRVSSEWFSRPDDERFISLTDLYGSVRGRAEHAQARTVESRAVRVEASHDNAERQALMVPGRDEPVAPTHWSFGQMCNPVSAPSSYMRQLPAPLAAINLQHGLLSHLADLVKTLEADDGRVELCAVTGPDYSRIWDHELVAAVIKIAGNGTGDTRWKVPGVLDWNRMMHHPFVDITKDTTTLYASDRDVFLFWSMIPSYRGRTLTGRIAGSVFARILLLEQRSWIEDARHRLILSSGRLHEPQSVGRREFRGNYYPAFQIRGTTVRS
jgi:hypothetical protein